MEKGHYNRGKVKLKPLGFPIPTTIVNQKKMEIAEISATVKDLKGAGYLFMCPLNSPVQPVQTLTESWRMTVNHKQVLTPITLCC